MQSVEVRGVLFDMDGVLVSSIGSVTRSWRRWAEHYGIPDFETLEVPHGVRAIEIIRKLLPSADAEEGLRLIEGIEMADTADLHVLPGAKELLISLPEGRWAVVTSATHRLLVSRLTTAGLPVPELLLSGDMVERGKPDPEPYRRGAALIRTPPSECLVVEDAPSGVRAGVAAGCQVLGVEGTHHAAELRVAGARWVVKSLEDVSATAGNGAIQMEMMLSS